MVKSIIKRIIVGVGIALVLMAIKGNLIASVSALTPKVVTPSAFHFSNNNSSTIYDRDLTSGTLDNTQIFYYTFTNTSTRTFFQFDYHNNNSLELNVPYSVSFSVYSSIPSSYPEPFRISINNGTKYYTCFVQSSSYTPSSNYGGFNGTDTLTFSTAYCPNIVLTSSKSFDIFVYSNMPTSSENTIIGITRATLVPDSSAEEIANVNNSIQDTKKAVEDTNNTLKDDTSPDDSDVNSLFDIDTNDSNTPVSDLISMPITLLQAYLDGFSASCSSFNLGTLYGHNLSIPCIQPQKYLGNSLYNLIDICISLFLAYNVGLMCISIYESITSLDDNFQSLYTPRHAQSEYKPKHGGSD